MNSYDDLCEVITSVLIAEHGRCLDESEDLVAVRNHLFVTLREAFTWKRSGQSAPEAEGAGGGGRRPRWSASN